MNCNECPMIEHVVKCSLMKHSNDSMIPGDECPYQLQTEVERLRKALRMACDFISNDENMLAPCNEVDYNCPDKFYECDTQCDESKVWQHIFIHDAREALNEKE